MSNDLLAKIVETTEFLKKYTLAEESTGIVLGTGLGALVSQIDVKHRIPYSEIPNFPLATVEFHSGHLVFGFIGETSVIAMEGRFHYYEGYSMQQITFPIRVMRRLGVNKLFLSNAAGGINANFKKGDLVCLDDHINLQMDSPLRGLTDPEFGSRFPDMSEPYSKTLSNKLFTKAKSLKIELKSGVYASVVGPNLETRAEYRYLRTIGADLVGMSTVPEVIVASQLELPCAVISVVTDECDPDNLKPVNISEIIAVAGKADEKLSSLLYAVISSINV